MLNKEATADDILAGGFDKVLLATGSVPFVPPIAGIKQDHVVTANDILLGKAKAEGSVVVIGGGLVGCETALHINETIKDVTVVEMLGDILAVADHCPNNDMSLRHMMKCSSIRVEVSAKVKEIGENTLTYEKDGQTFTIPADTVVVASGFRAYDPLSEALEDKVDFKVVGDAVKPGKIIDATRDAYQWIRLQ